MADQPRLTIAIGDYGHTRALKSGEVAIKGVAPQFVEVSVISIAKNSAFLEHQRWIIDDCSSELLSQHWHFVNLALQL